MDEQNSKKNAPKENEPARLLTDGDEKVNDAEKEGRAGQRNSGQTDHYIIWGLPWPQFVAATVALLGVIATIIMTSVTVYLRWYADTISQFQTREKERARIVPDQKWTSVDPFSFSVIFKNEGTTVALNTYGAWLQGECPGSFPKDCEKQCLRSLSETKIEGYGNLAQGREYSREFTYTPRKRKKEKGTTQDPPLSFYFCGYFAYRDIFCTWHRLSRCLYYEPTAEKVRFCAVGNDEEEEQIEGCRP